MARLKPEQEGDRIGHYTLLEEIGSGGFGTVWRAEQEEPVRRRVALKIIKMGMDTAEVIARFEQERQALAMMNHPNIAKVFDAGATQFGRPFFVMELVNGIPITQYCDQGRLGTRERLTLFGDVCAAINHAHQKGVIHRDIKPSNVMVSLIGGEPAVKVIDFGIAKATQGRLTDKTLFTRQEQFIGTPVYMSPEQASIGGLDIDTRSDIYALGILLYELLTGKPPYDAKELSKAAPDEVRRIIREIEPQKPSERLSTLGGEERTVVARMRRTEPGKLARLIESDLDLIVMKAIDKDRTRRYGTANELVDDIQRFMASKPVVARPPSVAYKFRKAWHRHNLVIGAGAAIVLALIAGAGVALWQAREARREKEIAKQRSEYAVRAEKVAQAEAARAGKAEKAARAESARARQIADFLTRLLDNAADEIKRGRNPEALKRALDQSANLLATLADEPALQSELLDKLASFYTKTGEWKPAMDMMQARVALIGRLSGRESAEAHKFELLYLRFVNDYGARATAPAKLEALKARIAESSGRGSLLWFDVQHELIRCWIKLESPREALACSAEGLAEAEKQNLQGKGLLRVHIFHVRALECAEQFDEAEKLLEECRKRAEKLEDPEKWLEQIDSRLLYILESKGDFAGGARILRRELAEVENGRGDRRNLISLLERLAKFESEAGEHDSAIKHGEAALALARELAATPGQAGNTFRAAIGAVLRQLAKCKIAIGRYEDAMRHADEALMNAESEGSLDSVSKAWQAKAQVHRAAGRLDEAYLAYEARDNVLQASKINYKAHAEAMWEMSEIRLKQGRPAEAVALDRKMWERNTKDQNAMLDNDHQRYVARHCLKSWKALLKADPEAVPPPELSAWQSAAGTKAETKTSGAAKD